ncbi:serine/threonine-protein kinase [Sandaracinus amylolyticus]|uniref:serine/threonine-protein kinase n=1 Tax=Sandaracinus amylolyticus TaxID=927083 RepID=UPI001F3DEFC9|nr:serine/threonine-protein kinase [Sandaracinus amylolyticus]UJR79715.1 Serine/threonine protein kinase PrkC, regulator of stationary phase [Sandaracinus amylolyticus]
MSRSGSNRGQADARASGVRFGDYELVTRIANGGMGAVWAARAPGPRGLARCVAMKVPHRPSEDAEAILDEAHIARAIDHPHVVRVLDVATDATGNRALVMEFVDGASLRELFEAETVPPRIAMRVVHDALLGLDAAHEARDEQGRLVGIVHCDVSPANVLVRTDGHALLTDFGVARTADRAPRTPPGRVKGKVGYLAPEQIRSQRIDRRTDVYAMGVVLWEMLAGRRLFEGGLAALLREPEREAPPIGTIAPTVIALQATLARALARDPAARFETASELARSIERAAPALGGLATREEVARHVKRVMGERIEGARGVIIAALEQHEDAVTRDVAPMRRERTGAQVRRREDDATRKARPSAVAEMGASGVRRRIRLEEASTELAMVAGDPTLVDSPVALAPIVARARARIALARAVSITRDVVQWVLERIARWR